MDKINPSKHERSFAALPHSLPPRGLHRETAAAYIGVSTTKFDEMVKDGRMPSPFSIDGRRVWDRRKVDIAFDELSGAFTETSNEWD